MCPGMRISLEKTITCRNDTCRRAKKSKNLLRIRHFSKIPIRFAIDNVGIPPLTGMRQKHEGDADESVLRQIA